MTVLKNLMMRRPGVVRLDAFQLNGFQHVRLPLHLFFQKLDELALPGHDLVQLFDLMFQMGDAGFELFEPLKISSFMLVIVRVFSQNRQTTIIGLLRRGQNAAGKSKAASAMETGSSVIGSS